MPAWELIEVPAIQSELLLGIVVLRLIFFSITFLFPSGRVGNSLEGINHEVTWRGLGNMGMNIPKGNSFYFP
jgi:hypothetical protein